MRISDWSADVCSSDLSARGIRYRASPSACRGPRPHAIYENHDPSPRTSPRPRHSASRNSADRKRSPPHRHARSEEHTSELQSLMRISYAVFCLKKKKHKKKKTNIPSCTHIGTTPQQKEQPTH